MSAIGATPQASHVPSLPQLRAPHSPQSSSGALGPQLLQLPLPSQLRMPHSPHDSVVAAALHAPQAREAGSQMRSPQVPQAPDSAPTHGQPSLAMPLQLSSLPACVQLSWAVGSTPPRHAPPT